MSAMVKGTTPRLAAGAASLLVAVCLLAGCTSARTNLGTSDSACYLALPSATKAVGPHSRFIGVHLFTLSSLRKQAPRVFDALPSEPASSDRVCAIGFVGTFTRTSVARPFGLATGTVAVVVSKTPSNQLLGTVLFDQTPIRFGHSHTG
ncbi:MAG TPA: hypothetical protein VG412_11705 [Acidimicrobiales bacterium]|nr:hypothetical protein [Acidimicrobiales bacterium]